MAHGHRTNPSADRYLEDKAMDNIDHALGRPVDPMGETYRNRFATCGPSQAAEFAASPHWEEHGRQGDMRFFVVTDAGRAALAAYLKTQKPHKKWEVTFEGHQWFCAARTVAKARYQEWLAVSDCRSDLTFADFCRNVRVRRAA